MSRKEYIILNVVMFFVEEVGLLVVILYLLPLVGINLPLWATILVLVGFGISQYIGYKISIRVLEKKVITSPESMVGCHGKVISDLNPRGYVRIQGELWRATSTVPEIERDNEVVVKEVNRMALLVAPTNADEQRTQ